MWKNSKMPSRSIPAFRSVDYIPESPLIAKFTSWFICDKQFSTMVVSLRASGQSPLSTASRTPGTVFTP